ncbi:MAG: methyltransferase domain-containing protein [Candidatus Alcyoniella australis]|nr:methyltransferase domain-containing protein [Candidatus Alcyoniella australis]
MHRPRMIHRACPLCGCEGGVPTLEATDLLQPDGPGYRVVRCAVCGLMRTDPQVAPEDRELIYGPDYAPHEQPPLRLDTMNPLGARLRRIDFERTVRHRNVADEGLLLKLAARAFGLTRSGRFLRFWFPGKGRRVLDVGCGTGGIAALLAAVGWQACGIEINERAAQRARERGLDIWSGDFADPQAALPDSWLEQRFDLLIFHHSLEHMADPLAVLSRARSLLKRHGVIYLALPNAAGPLARAFGPHWYPLDLPRHVVHFTPQTLRRTLEVAGFEPTRWHQTLSARTIERSLEAARDRRRPSTLLRLLQRLSARPRALRALTRISGALGLGDSMHCYACIVHRPDEVQEQGSVYEHKGAYHWRETGDDPRTYNAFLAARYQAIVRRAQQIAPALCVDAGCGDGRLSSMLAAAGHNVVAADVDQAGLKIAAQREMRATFIRADAARLPIRSNAAGLLTSADVLEHLPDGAALLDELQRVCAPAGTLLLSTPNRQAAGPADLRHVREWTDDELRYDLRERFQRVSIEVLHPARWHRVYRARMLGRELLRVPLNLLALRLNINPFLRTPADRRDGLQLVARCNTPRVGRIGR